VNEPVNLFAQQEANRRRSRWLVIGFIAFFAWLGFGGDLILWLGTQEVREGTTYRHVVPWLGIAMTTMAAALTWFSWRRGPESVLWAAGARELTQPRGPEELLLVNVVEEMAVASGLPRPRIFLIYDGDPNAFATGHDPRTAAIAVTEGLLRICDRDELQAVIGHEMGHVKNFDMQLMTLLASLVGTVALVSDGLGRMIRSGRFIGTGSLKGGGKKGGNPLIIVLLVLWIVSWVVAPLVTRLLALGVSRKREYLADAMSAQFTRNPIALATALQKIEHAHEPTSSIGRGFAHLCIADPLGRAVTSREGFLADALSTHPPMALRVARLKAMGYQEQKRSGTYQPAPLTDPAATRTA
jgi:heat shock protein HtpX